jgi:hypothetical protein
MTKTHEELKKLLGDFIRLNNKKGVASFASINEKGVICDKGLSSGCHANLRYMSKGAVLLSNWHQNMTTYLEDVKSYPSMRRFAEYLIQRSNFADAFVTKDLDDVLKNGFMVDCTLPRDYVSAASVATRVCYEKPGKTTLWGNLVDLGVNENLAFLMTSQMLKIEKLENKYLDYTLSREGSHYTYTITNGPSRSYVENVIKGEYNKQVAGEPFKTSPGYSGFTHIWRKDDRTGYEDGWLIKLMEKFTEKLVIGGRDPNNLNPWGEHPPARNVSNFNVEKFNEEIKKEFAL